MWKVNMPDLGDPVRDLDKALTYASGKPKYKLSDTERELLISVYKKYKITMGQAHDDYKGMGFSESSREAIYQAYQEVQESGRLQELRSRILLSVGRCPICGISAADELDHYLPRSLFKLLSIYVLNLLPICHKCNNKKRTISGEDETKKFPHHYFIDLPNVRFFFARCTFENQGLKVQFYIKKVKGVSQNLYDQLVYQIDRVGLNGRLETEVNVFLQSLSPSFDLVYLPGKDASALSNFLGATAKDFSESFGLNDWRTALMEALSQVKGFCDGGYKHVVTKV